MTKKLSEKVPEGILALLAKHVPSPFPWTFTHGDLTNRNIMVYPETFRLTGIIDWESSGYYPVWWEFVCANPGDGPEDAEWKASLRKYMPEYIDAWKLWKELYSYRFVGRWPSTIAKERQERLRRERERELEIINLDR